MTSIPSNSPRIPKNGYQYTNNEIKNMTPNSILTSNLSGKNPGHFNETEAFNEGYYYAITSNNASCYTFGNYTLTFFVLLKENEDASDNVDEKYVYSIYDNSTGRAVQIDDTDPNFDAKVREKFGMSYIELICKRGVLSYSVEQNTVLFNPAAASKARESDGSGGVPGGEGSSQVGSPDGVPGGTLVMKPLDSNSTHEVQLKDWAISNYINGYNGNHQIFEGMGFWDKTGAVITDAFGDDITIKGLFNEHSNSHQKAKPLQDFQIQLRNNQVLYVQDEYFEERYQEIMGVPYDAQAAENLYNLSTDYKMASYYKKLLGELENLLEEYRNKLGLNHADQWGSIQDEYIEKLKNLIGAGGDAESKKLLEAIEWGINQGYYVEPATGNDIVVCSIRQQYNLVQKHYNYALNGRSYEQLEREYKTTYKKLYGEEDKSEILIDQVGSAQMAGQVIKLTAVVILTELITQSPYLTEFMAQFLGGIPLAGRALEAMNNLIARFNGSIVREALKRVAGAQVFALTDAALTQVDGDWNKTADVFKNDEIYGLIGGLVISPIANKVGKIAGYSEDVFGGAKSVTVGANVTSRTITGEQLLNSTKNFINSLPEKALSTGVEITGFATVMQMVDDVDSNTAMDESAKMQAEMQIINNFVAFIMGGRGRGIYSRKTIEKATNDLGVKDWKISEEKTKTKEGTKTEIVVRDKKGKVLFRAENIDAVRLEISARIEAQAAAITKKPEMGLNGDESTRMNDAYNPDHTLDEVVVMLDNSGPEPAFVTNKQEGVSKEQM